MLHGAVTLHEPWQQSLTLARLCPHPPLPATQYDQELRLWGINIKDLMFNKQKPFILSEYGA